jgi:glycosyltransferase involved in cell wall biosynthesis
MSSFTVVLPVKNGEATIRTAVVSTLRALPTDARLLVRDDGSNDRTVQVLKKISDRRLEIVLGDSVGLARSMNLLMEQVQTELFARMDADDVSLPNRFLREQRAVAEGADFVFAPVVNWKSRTPLLKPQSPRSMSAAASPFHLLVENPFMVPTLLARTSAYRELGGSREVPSEDYELWLRAASAGYRLVRMAVPTLVYRRHASQVSAQKSWLAARAHTTIVEDSFNLLAARTIGFVPSWFAWRRDGFRAGEAPDRVIVDLDAMLKSTTELRVDERRPLERRIRFMRRRALARS